jgi:UDP-glucose 6-dehydrogenase
MSLETWRSTEAAILIIVASAQVLATPCFDVISDLDITLVTDFNTIENPVKEPGLSTVLADHAPG